MEKALNLLRRNQAGILFGLVFVYLIGMQYFLLGITTWDGFTYRMVPAVEILQHGVFDGMKFVNGYTRFATPFLEYINIPFLRLFGLKGLYFSFSLTLLPLSAAAVFLLLQELSGKNRWGMFGALAFLSIPFVNEQPFSGYVDFAVLGTLAFYLFSLLWILRVDVPKFKHFLCLFFSLVLFTNSRQQAPYLSVFFYGAIVAGDFFIRRKRARAWKQLAAITAAFGLGIAPAFAIQLYRWITLGSPIFPYQFSFLFIKSSAGMPLERMLRGVNFTGSVPGWYASRFISSWVIPQAAPGGFFDSANFGAGITLYLAVFSLFLHRKYQPFQVFILAVLGLSSLVTQDFWLPRYAYGLTMVLVILIGAALAELRLQKRVLPFAILLGLIVVQLLGRPVYMAVNNSQPTAYSIRSNFSESPLFIDKSIGIMPVFKDQGADYVSLSVYKEFYLLMYGPGLTNQINMDVPAAKATDLSCADLKEYLRPFIQPANNRPVLIVDQLNRAAGRCAYTCNLQVNGVCQAYNLP